MRFTLADIVVDHVVAEDPTVFFRFAYHSDVRHILAEIGKDLTGLGFIEDMGVFFPCIQETPRNDPAPGDRVLYSSC